jgi:hypothetical protein
VKGQIKQEKEVCEMKRLGIFVLGVMLMSMCASAYAANPATFDVTVTVQLLSVVIDNELTRDFGTVQINSQTMAPGDFDIRNDGNAAEDFQLQITARVPGNLVTNEALSPMASPADDNNYKLYGMFDNDGLLLGVAIAPGDYADLGDVIFESAARDTDVNFLSGDNDADNVGAGTTVYLWLMFESPPDITAAWPQEQITVTVTAIVA